MLDAAETEIYSQEQRRHVFITLSLPFSQDAAETEIDSQAKTIAGKRAELNRRHSQRKAHSLLIRGIRRARNVFQLSSLFILHHTRMYTGWPVFPRTNYVFLLQIDKMLG